MPGRFLTLVLATTALAACSGAEPATAPPTRASAVPATGRATLVFFMNPNGHPCQMQDEILRSMPDLGARVDVVRVKTTEPGDIPRFERYGIRSLPQLLLVDASGAVLRRPTPGILSDPQVRQLVTP